jgi:hypothetical protein
MSSSLKLENEKKNESWKPESALDVLIALLYAEGSHRIIGEPIEGLTRLDKLMFLLSETEEFKDIIREGYVFEADNFGPFAPELFDDIESLKQENLLNIISSREPRSRAEVADEEVTIKDQKDEESPENDYSVNKYQLTSNGFKIGELLWNGLTDKQKEKILVIKKTWAEKELVDLLHYVYKRYPETTEKSKIKDRVLSNRRD